MGPGGRHFEVQIRTDEMHRIAEEGIAAHWKYKEGKRGPAAGVDDQRIAWLRQLVEWQREMRDPGEFMSTLKVDLSTLKKSTRLRRAAMVIAARRHAVLTFAYSVHSGVGDTCIGAKVNGRIVPLKSTLRNGDVVEIMTQANHLPSKDWLSFDHYFEAPNGIKHVINTTERAKAIEIGEKYLDREARRLGVPMAAITKAALESGSRIGLRMMTLPKMEGSARRARLRKIFRARQVLQKLAPDKVVDKIPDTQPAAVPTPSRAPGAPGDAADKDLVLKVKGIDDLLVYRAKCCNPIRGEAIVGYVTRGKGVAVHSLTCANVQNLMYEVERKIDVEWARSESQAFPVKMSIHTADRPGMLNQLTSALLAEQTNIRSLEARGEDLKSADGAVIDVTIEVRDKKQLEKVVSAIRRISGVKDIERVQDTGRVHQE